MPIFVCCKVSLIIEHNITVQNFLKVEYGNDYNKKLTLILGTDFDQRL